MAKYLALRDTWLSHENRLVKENEEFETTFPKVNGKEQVLSSNIKKLQGGAKQESETSAVLA